MADIDDAFLKRFKQQTEAGWSEATIDSTVYGFQFQRGTRWNPGLSEDEISEYELQVGARFPNDLRNLLRLMNGTDLPTLNVYGKSGEPRRTSIGVYSYPRDLIIVKARLADVAAERKEIEGNLEGFVLGASVVLVPFYSHRFVVCGSDPSKSVVLSICGNDAIVYGQTLRQYLQIEFLNGRDL